jgi:hypothetical protein
VVDSSFFKDHEGFPRADIDLYRARSLRKRLAEIKTDLKAIMINVEKELQNLMVAQVRCRKFYIQLLFMHKRMLPLTNGVKETRG